MRTAGCKLLLSATWRVQWQQPSSCCQRASLKRTFTCRLQDSPTLVSVGGLKWLMRAVVGAGVSCVINHLPSCFGPRVLSEWWLHNSSSNWAYSQEIGAATSAVLPIPAWFRNSYLWVIWNDEIMRALFCLHGLYFGGMFQNLGKKIFLSTQCSVESSDSLTHSLSSLFECAVFKVLI